MAHYYLSVDGGGSSTEFCLTDAKKDIVCFFKVGSTSKKSVGDALAQAAIYQGVKQLQQELSQRGISLDDVRGVWGLSGLDCAVDQAVYEKMVSNAGLDLSLHSIHNDSILPLRSVTMGPGIVVISGTGSVAVGVDSQGIPHRVGGWGYQFSDLGSGCWVGSQLLQETLLFADGCREEDPAFEAVRQHAGCSFESLGELAQDITRADQIASFAQIAFETPDSPVCQRICETAASYLAGYAISMANQLTLLGETDFDVVLSGGLFNATYLRENVIERISKATSLTEERIHHLTTSPVMGGINVAIRNDQ